MTMMSKRLGYVAIPTAIIIGLIIFFPDSNKEIEEVYHITLADPNLYNEDGIFIDSFEVQDGKYQFRFVPNGDSPQNLSILLEGDSFSFSEDFELIATPHGNEISLYYTWDYEGEKTIQIDDAQQIIITIDPHGNILGPVSVDILPLK